jgi:hypothetical protein
MSLSQLARSICDSPALKLNETAGARERRAGRPFGGGGACRSQILDPATTWPNRDAYHHKYLTLAAWFVENFKLMAEGCPAGVAEGGRGWSKWGLEGTLTAFGSIRTVRRKRLTFNIESLKVP